MSNAKSLLSLWVLIFELELELVLVGVGSSEIIQSLCTLLDIRKNVRFLSLVKSRFTCYTNNMLIINHRVNDTFALTTFFCSNSHGVKNDKIIPSLLVEVYGK